MVQMDEGGFLCLCVALAEQLRDGVLAFCLCNVSGVSVSTQTLQPLNWFVGVCMRRFLRDTRHCWSLSFTCTSEKLVGREQCATEEGLL